jgi:hypothetical protein
MGLFTEDWTAEMAGIRRVLPGAVISIQMKIASIAPSAKPFQIAVVPRSDVPVPAHG